MPMVLHSHGWGGSRTTDPGAFAYLTDAGFGVLSFDQRGFGESGGKAHIENPDVEGKDVQADRRPRRRAAVGAEAAAGRPGARRDRRVLRRRLPVRRGAQRGPRPRGDPLRRAGPRDHLVQPDREPVPAGRAAHGVGGGAHRGRAADRRPPAAGGAGLRRGGRDGQRADVPPRLPRPQRPRVAPAAGPPARRAGALRPGRDRQPLPPRPGAEELRPGAHRQGALAEHLRRLQRRAHPAGRAAGRDQPRHPAGDRRRVLARPWAARTSPTSASGSSSRTSRAGGPG